MTSHQTQISVDNDNKSQVRLSSVLLFFLRENIDIFQIFQKEDTQGSMMQKEKNSDGKKFDMISDADSYDEENRKCEGDSESSNSRIKKTLKKRIFEKVNQNK